MAGSREERWEGKETGREEMKPVRRKGTRKGKSWEQGRNGRRKYMKRVTWLSNASYHPIFFAFILYIFFVWPSYCWFLDRHCVGYGEQWLVFMVLARVRRGMYVLYPYFVTPKAECTLKNAGDIGDAKQGEAENLINLREKALQQ